MPIQDREMFSNIVATLRESLLILDSDLKVMQANPAFYNTFQVSQSDTEGRMIWELGNGQWNIPALHRLLGEILPTQNPVIDFLVEHDFPSIGQKVMLLNATKLEGRDLILLAIDDITERRKVEDDRRTASENYKLMVDSVSDYAIFMLDAKVKTWNDACERVKGWKAEEVIGRYFSIFHTPEDVKNGKPESELDICRETGRYTAEETRVRSDGTEYWAKINLSAIYQGGEIVGFAKVLQNIDHRKRAELEAQQSQAALREAGRRKDEFLAMLAHELRNPMAPIVSGIQLIQATRPTNDVVVKALDRMDRQSTTLIRLVDDLMDVSRITRGKIKLQIERVRLTGVVEQAIDSVYHHIAHRHQHLHKDLCGDLELEADQARLQQIIGNLVNNASKYTQDKGNIWVSCSQEGDDIIISVRDNGIGIPTTSQDYIFDLFFQENPSPQTGGLGIGLTLVKSLVNLHHGTIEVKSEGSGKG